MKNFLIGMVLCALSLSSVYSLEPLNVAIINTDAGPHNLTVEVNNYNGGVVNIYSENFNGVSPNSSGVISFTLGVGSATWTGISSASVTSYYIIDVKIGSTLYAQYRLDELIRLQAQSGITDSGGNIIPGEDDASSLGSDSQRWKDVFVGPASIHIGASGDEGSVSYNTSSNTLNLTADITNTTGDLTVGGATNFEIKGNNGNITTAGRVDLGGNLRFTSTGSFITHTNNDDIRVHNNFVIGNAGNDNFKVVNGSGNTTIKGKTEINNNNSGAGNASLKLTNDDATNESFALNITQGHQALSVDNSTTTIGNGNPITVGVNTIIRLKSGGGNISGNLISDGQTKGQILYITNEDAGEIDLDDSNIIGAAKIDPRSVLHLIWVGNKWMVINRY
jgi:hypothetical protein